MLSLDSGIHCVLWYITSLRRGTVLTVFMTARPPPHLALGLSYLNSFNFGVGIEFLLLFKLIPNFWIMGILNSVSQVFLIKKFILNFHNRKFKWRLIWREEGFVFDPTWWIIAKMQAQCVGSVVRRLSHCLPGQFSSQLLCFSPSFLLLLLFLGRQRMMNQLMLSVTWQYSKILRKFEIHYSFDLKCSE